MVWLVLLLVGSALVLRCVDRDPEAALPPQEIQPPLVSHTASSKNDSDLRRAWISQGGVRGRSEPGFDIEPCATFYCGEPVHKIIDIDGWDLVITKDGKALWVESQDLTFYSGSRVRVIHTNVPGRPKPSIASAPVTYLTYDDGLEMLRHSRGWTQVKLVDGSKLWVPSDSIRSGQLRDILLEEACR